MLGGIVSPSLYALADAVAGSRWVDYSFRDQTISELGAVGAPSQPLFGLLLVPVYVALVAFGLGVWRSAARRHALRAVGVLLAVLGVMALTVGPFVPMRPRGTSQGLAGALHLVEGGIAVALIVAAIGIAATAFGRRFRLYSLVTIAVVFAFGGWSALDAPAVEAGLTTPWLGVKERIFWYAYQSWYAVLALKLWREA